MRGISVVTHARANAGNLIGGHAGSHAAAADEHAALRFFVDHRAAHRFGEIRIVRRIFVERAHVQHFMAQRTQQIADGHFQLKAGVIGANHQFHAAHFPRTSFAAATTFSGRKPNLLSKSFKGAEAPKVCMPIILPLGPTYRSQPIVAAISTDTRAVMAEGNTLSRYAASCFSKSSQQGMLTTRALIPSGLPFAASARTYAPLATPEAGAYLVRSNVGRAWRVSTSVAGLCRS